MPSPVDDVPHQIGALSAETRASGNLLALTEISRLINTSLDPQELCETVVGLLRQTFAYDRAAIHTVELAALFEGPGKPALPEIELTPIAFPWFSSPRAYLAPEPDANAARDADEPARWRLLRRTTSGDNAAPANISLMRGVMGRTARTGQPTFLPDISRD